MEIRWKDVYNVGHDILDEQHKKIFEILSKIENAQLYEKELILKDALQEFSDYVNSHFQTEEHFMKKWGVPEDYLKIHKREHSLEKKAVSDLIEKYYKSEALFLSVELLDELKNWVIGHVLGTDREYIPYVKDEK